MAIFQSTFKMVLCVSLAATHYYSVRLYCPVALLDQGSVMYVSVICGREKQATVCKKKQNISYHWVVSNDVLCLKTN